MATKKNTKKKPTRRVVTKVTSAKELARKGRTAKKLSQKKPAPKKVAAKSNAAGKEKMIGRKTVGAGKRQTREKRQREDAAAFTRKTPNTYSGDLQGLRNVEGADSESVDELLEEGNSFEADVVKGVEDAENADEREVHTHEVPQDDVPDEYLDRK